MRLSVLSLSFLLLTGAASATSELVWSELIDPAAQNFDDPYRDINYDHLQAVATVAQLRARLTQEDLTEDARTQTETHLAETETTLSAAGIDADWLIKQRWVVAELRERAARAGNPAVDGAVVTLAGFAIPAPADEKGTPMAYLVPERGMCAHMPPPPPNQMIRMRMPAIWKPRMMHEPLQVTGRLTIDPSETQVMIVDGFVPMRATFVMQVQDLQTLRRGQAAAAQDTVAANDWVARIQQRVRAANGASAHEN